VYVGVVLVLLMMMVVGETEEDLMSMAALSRHPTVYCGSSFLIHPGALPTSRRGDEGGFTVACSTAVV
jgi:hypothetical protein